MASKQQYLRRCKESFKFRPNETFMSHSLSVLEAMRQNQELCDVKILVREGCISAHRAVLSGAIPFFRAMFSGSLKESEKDEISVDGVDPGALELIINFVYGSEVEITTENVQSLLVASDFLQIDDVKKECCKFMSYNLYPENVLEVISLAQSLNCLNLIERCHCYIRENFEDFYRSESFLSLPFSVLQDVTSRDDIRIESEETVFEAIISWIKASNMEEDKRTDMLCALISNVRFDQLSIDYLCDSVSSEDLIQNCAPVKGLLLRAKAFHFPQKYTKVIPISATPKRHYTKSVGFNEYDRNARRDLFAVCNSHTFGLYVRHFDSRKEKWITLGNGFLFKAVFISAITLGESICVFGDSGIRSFNLRTRSWKNFPKTESPIFHKFLLHRDKIYLFQKYLLTVISDLCLGQKTCNKIQSFSLSNGELIPAGQMTRCSDDFSIVSLGEFIYVTGGSTDSKCVNIVERYQPESRLWTRIPPMPTAKKNHSSAALNEKLYVCGGSNDAEEKMDSVEVYSNISKQWICVAPMKMGRSSFSLTSAMGKLFLIDRIENCDIKYCLETYDPDADQWKDGPPLFVLDDVSMTPVELTSNSSNGH